MPQTDYRRGREVWDNDDDELNRITLNCSVTNTLRAEINKYTNIYAYCKAEGGCDYTALYRWSTIVNPF